ncbi:hypothetical protein D3Y55_25015 [Mesorhizobium sp. DCY119]|nr:hypothetical protein D3Y55_25015 [Mesorhizobium sp. DCY119]
MSTQSAEVIDLQIYRRERIAKREILLRDLQQTIMPGAMPMAWVPVWFMPVYFVGMPANAH